MRYLVTTENSALDDHLVSPRILVTSSMLETLRNNLKHFSERFLLLQILTLKLALATSWILEILWNSCNLFQKNGLENTRFPSPWQNTFPLRLIFSWRLPNQRGGHRRNSMPGRSSKVKRPRQKSTSFSAMAFRNTYQKMTAIQVIQVVAVKNPLSWRSLSPLKGHNHTKKVTLNHRDLVMVADCLEFAKNCGGTDSGPPPPKKNSAVHSMESFPRNRKRYLKSWDPSNASGAYIWAKANWISSYRIVLYILFESLNM